MTSSTRLRDEIARQKSYLAGLPNDYAFPLFNAKTALESQRRSGYQSTAAAAREIVDNAIEAGAERIHVSMEGRQSVEAIAFIDDGAGMVPGMIRAALSWGGGTRFEKHDFIGKFGFGLPNASINQTRRVEVYSRVEPEAPFHMAYLDVSEFDEWGVQAIKEAQPAELPGWVQRYVKKAGLNLDHGTVVVWVRPDRLTYRSSSYLKRHVVDDFGVVYRYLLQRPGEKPTVDRPELVVEGTKIEPVDPLFLDPTGRYYEPPVDDDSFDRGGARLVTERLIPVRYYRDAVTGERHLARVSPDDEVDPSDPNLLALGSIKARVARFPYGFIAGVKTQARTPEAYLRFQIRKSRRGISFVRSGREIETVDAFPKSDRDRESGLGNWPLLQAYAYHWGVELSFHPDLDEAFGITNDKQSVRPLEDLWRVLTQDGVDRLLQAEQSWQKLVRSEEEKRRRSERPAGPTPAELAAQAADTATGKRPRLHGSRRQEAEEQLEQEAKKQAEQHGRGLEEVKKALEDEAKKHRYRVEFFENEYAPFFVPEYRLGKFIVRINRKHAFYDEFYGKLDGTAARDAVDLLLIALARAELTVEEETMMQFYVTQRRDVWSPFLNDSLRILSQTEHQEEAEEQPEGEAELLIEAEKSEEAAEAPAA